MKKRLKYFLISIIVLFQVSCNNWMELIPPGGLIREEFWKTKEDVEAVLMASYESFATMDAKLFVYGEVRADMLEGDYNQPWEERLLSEGNVYPDNRFSNWSDFYKDFLLMFRLLQILPKKMMPIFISRKVKKMIF